ncbi:hypothetical protein ACFE04_023736 [Oxalis oulophora]
MVIRPAQGKAYKENAVYFLFLNWVRLVTDKLTNKPRGYGFIEYARTQDMKAAYKQADGKKIDGRRVLVDVERGRTVPNWRPRRLGGGLGTSRVGGEDPNPRARAIKRSISFGGAKDTGRPPWMWIDLAIEGIEIRNVRNLVSVHMIVLEIEKDKVYDDPDRERGRSRGGESYDRGGEPRQDHYGHYERGAQDLYDPIDAVHDDHDRYDQYADHGRDRYDQMEEDDDHRYVARAPSESREYRRSARSVSREYDL